MNSNENEIIQMIKNKEIDKKHQFNASKIQKNWRKFKGQKPIKIPDMVLRYTNAQII